jgi:hypothetical protein
MERNGEEFEDDPYAKGAKPTHIDYEFDRKSLSLFWKRSDEDGVQKYSCVKMK